jgi:hypothetical protein
MSRCRAVVFAITLLGFGSIAKAQVTYTGTTSADAFLATGSSNNPEGNDLTGLNFGAAGTVVVAPAASVKGEFQSVLKFSLSNAVALFNTNYGEDNWTITGISIQLTSNYGTSGVQPNNAIFPMINSGNFVIEWLSDDDWVEGTGTPNLPTTDGVTYDSLPALLSGAHEILNTNTYTPPGNNLPVIYTLPLNTNLVADVSDGGDVSFLLYAVDNQIGYLFNSYNYGRGNEPLINVTATLRVLPLKILSGYFTNKFFHLTGVGGTNLPYQVQANSDLTTTNWQTIGTVTADSVGMIQYDDTAATNSQRFYRLSLEFP